MHPATHSRPQPPPPQISLLLTQPILHMLKSPSISFNPHLSYMSFRSPSPSWQKQSIFSRLQSAYLASKRWMNKCTLYFHTDSSHKTLSSLMSASLSTLRSLPWCISTALPLPLAFVSSLWCMDLILHLIALASQAKFGKTLLSQSLHLMRKPNVL